MSVSKTRNKPRPTPPPEPKKTAPKASKVAPKAATEGKAATKSASETRKASETSTTRTAQALASATGRTDGFDTRTNTNKLVLNPPAGALPQGGGPGVQAGQLQTTRALSFGLPSLPNPIDIGRDIIDGGRRLLDGAGNLLQAGLDKLREFTGNTVRGFQDFVKDSFETVQEQAAAVKQFVSDALAPLDIGRQVNQLGPGDTYTLGAGVSATAEVAVEAAGEISVTRNDDGTYTVAGGANAAVGIGLTDDIDGTIGAGVKVEYSFDNPQDAARAAEILAKSAASAAIAGSGPGAALVGVLPGVRPSAEDLQFLGQNISALELSGEAAASLGVELPVNIGHLTPAAGIEATAGQTARIEFQNGQPSALVFQNSLGATGSAQSGLLNSQFPGLIPPTSAGASFDASVTLETRIPLDNLNLNLNPGDLLRDPVGTLRGNLRNLPEPQYTLKGSIDVGYEHNGQQGGFTTELSAQITPAELARSGFVGQLLSGNFQGALGSLNNNTTVSLTGGTYQDHGIDTGVSATFAGANFQAERRDLTPGNPIEGHPREAFNEFLRRLQALAA
jgi:hypothetical protein